MNKILVLILTSAFVLGASKSLAASAGNARVNSCELLLSHKLKAAELAQVEQLGYRIKVQRSAFRAEVFGAHEYFILKEARLSAGDLYLEFITTEGRSNGRPELTGREFRLWKIGESFKSLLGLASSVPYGMAKSKVESSTARFDSLPSCRE